jgi:hypothetical protein
MTAEQLKIRNNEIIAQFLNLKPCKIGKLEGFILDGSKLLPEELDFDCSWDMIMPVVEKIENIGHAIEICQNDVTIFEHDSKNSLNELLHFNSVQSKLDAVYNAVLAFTNWHNQQPK